MSHIQPLHQDPSPALTFVRTGRDKMTLIIRDSWLVLAILSLVLVLAVLARPDLIAYTALADLYTALTGGFSR